MIRYDCVSCGYEFQSEGIVYLCPVCKNVKNNGFQKGILSVKYEPQKKTKRNSMAEPDSFLPIAIQNSSALKVGNTPLLEPTLLRKEIGLPNLFIKNDSLNPSGSLKDRASLLIAEQAIFHNEQKIVLASTGNAGSAMACISAAYGLKTVLFIPETAPKEKIAQSIFFGASVIPVKGTYDDAYKLSLEYTERFGGINRNTAYNPFTIEGKKTVSIELYNQLGFKAPDIIYIPAGDGVIYSAVCKGFIDLKQEGLIDKLPLCILVQAKGSDAIVKSWRERRDLILEKTDTIADSISVKSPANAEMAIDYLCKTNSWGISISDEEILHAQKKLATKAGIFVEPSAAAAWAGLESDLRKKLINQDMSVVLLVTGSGFKDMNRIFKESKNSLSMNPLAVRE